MFRSNPFKSKSWAKKIRTAVIQAIALGVPTESSGIINSSSAAGNHNWTGLNSASKSRSKFKKRSRQYKGKCVA